MKQYIAIGTPAYNDAHKKHRMIIQAVSERVALDVAQLKSLAHKWTVQEIV